MNPCPFCGAKSCQQLRNELAMYDLSLGDEWFIHQLVVDAYTAQHAEQAKPIGVSFALVGLYLVFEKGLTGRQVQKMHMNLANKRGFSASRSETWPKFDPPSHEWPLTVADVMQLPEGEPRNEMIKKWGQSVWEIWKQKQLQEIEKLIELL